MRIGKILLDEGGYTKTQITKALGFNRSSFYYQSKMEKKDKGLANKIENWHETDDTLGHKKLANLTGAGKERIRRVMKKYGIKARQKRKKYKYPGKSSQVYPNLANDERETEKYKDVIFSDIFEFKLKDGSIVRGCFALRRSTRQILSLTFDYSMAAGLVVETVKGIKGIRALDEGEGRYIWHSDQGKQYGAEETIEAALQRRLVPSMSRAGTPTDNPYAERFVGVFKLAVVYRRKYQTLGEFLVAAQEWTNFYNNLRPHEGLNQKSPNDYAVEIGVGKIHTLHLF